MKSAPQIDIICIQKIAEDFKLFLSLITSTSLFVQWKCADVGDKEPLLLNIFTSVFANLRCVPLYGTKQ